MTQQRKLTREEITAPIDGEVEALENHEKEKWFTFFTKDALIEDLVPHARAARARSDVTMLMGS